MQLAIAIARTAAHANSVRIESANLAERYLLETGPLSATSRDESRRARDNAQHAVDALDCVLGESSSLVMTGGSAR